MLIILRFGAVHVRLVVIPARSATWSERRARQFVVPVDADVVSHGVLARVKLRLWAHKITTEPRRAACLCVVDVSCSAWSPAPVSVIERSIPPRRWLVTIIAI